MADAAACGVNSFVQAAGSHGCNTKAPYCGCNVLGGNTFVDDFGAGAGLGIPTLGTAVLQIDAGDACRWQPRSLHLIAFPAGLNANEIAATTTVDGRVPVVLTNAAVGSIPMIRRTGQLNFGIISTGYSAEKELTCVDWAAFTSTQNQGLSLSIYNPNTVPVHAFVDLWGDNLSG